MQICKTESSFLFQIFLMGVSNIPYFFVLLTVKTKATSVQVLFSLGSDHANGKQHTFQRLDASGSQTGHLWMFSVIYLYFFSFWISMANPTISFFFQKSFSLLPCSTEVDTPQEEPLNCYIFLNTIFSADPRKGSYVFAARKLHVHFLFHPSTRTPANVFRAFTSLDRTCNWRNSTCMAIVLSAENFTKRSIHLWCWWMPNSCLVTRQIRNVFTAWRKQRRTFRDLLLPEMWVLIGTYLMSEDH